MNLHGGALREFYLFVSDGNSGEPRTRYRENPKRPKTITRQSRDEVGLTKNTNIFNFFLNRKDKKWFNQIFTASKGRETASTWVQRFWKPDTSLECFSFQHYSTYSIHGEHL